jgi:hypothetical protein
MKWNGRNLVLVSGLFLVACDPIGPNSPDALANKLASATSYSPHCGPDRYTEKALTDLQGSPYGRDFEEAGKYHYKVVARVLELNKEAATTDKKTFCARIDSLFR